MAYFFSPHEIQMKNLSRFLRSWMRDVKASREQQSFAEMWELVPARGYSLATWFLHFHVWAWRWNSYLCCCKILNCSTFQGQTFQIFKVAIVTSVNVKDMLYPGNLLLKYLCKCVSITVVFIANKNIWGQFKKSAKRKINVFFLYAYCPKIHG